MPFWPDSETFTDTMSIMEEQKYQSFINFGLKNYEWSTYFTRLYWVFDFNMLFLYICYPVLFTFLFCHLQYAAVRSFDRQIVINLSSSSVQCPLTAVGPSYVSRHVGPSCRPVLSQSLCCKTLYTGRLSGNRVCVCCGTLRYIAATCRTTEVPTGHQSPIMYVVKFAYDLIND